MNGSVGGATFWCIAPALVPAVQALVRRVDYPSVFCTEIPT